MKKLFMMLTVGAVILTGCTATNLTVSTAAIIGTWKGYATMEEWRSTLVLTPEGKYSFIAGRNQSDRETGNWSTKGDTILFQADEPAGRERSFRFSTKFKNSLNFYEPKDVDGKEQSHVEAGMWELEASKPVVKEEPTDIAGYSWWAPGKEKDQVVNFNFPTDYSGNNEQKFVLTVEQSPSNGGGVKGTYAIQDGVLELTFDTESAQLNGESCSLNKFATTNPFKAVIKLQGQEFSLDKALEGKLFSIAAGTPFQRH